MVSEVVAGLSALKGAFDLAKSVKGLSDDVGRNLVAIELQRVILDAQAAHVDSLQERNRSINQR